MWKDLNTGADVFVRVERLTFTPSVSLIKNKFQINYKKFLEIETIFNSLYLSTNKCNLIATLRTPLSLSLSLFFL